MKRVAALSTALLLPASVGSYYETPRNYEQIETAPAMTDATESLPNELSFEASLSVGALHQMFNVSLKDTQHRDPGIDAKLHILGPRDTVNCILNESLNFPLHGWDPTVANNCMGESTIVVSQAFVEAHLETSKDPRAATSIVLAQVLAYTMMQTNGDNTRDTDKAVGEHMADCIAGNSFSALPVAKQSHLESVFSESIQTVSDDIAGREAAFATGLAGKSCDS